MRERLRRWFRRVALAAIAAGALLSAAHLAPVRDRVRLLAIAAARDRLDTALAIDRLDYNLLTLTFTLHGVRAAATRMADSPFFRADVVTIGLGPEALAGRLAFSSIDLVRPRLAFTRGADGRYRLPSGRGGSGRMPRLQIGRLTVAGLDVAIEGAPPLTIEARDVSAALEPSGGRIQGRLIAANGTRFRTPAGTVVDLGVDGLIGLSPDTLLIGPTTVTLGASRVEVKGRLPFAPGPARLDLDWRGSASLEDAARIWPALGSARGRVTAAGTLAGPFSDLALAFDATAGTSKALGFEVTGAAGRGRIGGGAITLESATVDVAGGHVTGAASFGLRTGAASTASARWQGVDLEALLRALGVAHPFPLAAGLEGDATFAWDERGLPALRVVAGLAESQAQRLAPQGGRLAPEETARAGPAALPVEGTARLAVTGAKWALDLDQRLGKASRVAGRLSGELNGARFGASTIGGRLDGEVATSDVSEALALTAGVPKALLTTIQRVQGTVATALGWSGTLGDPRWAVLLDGTDLRVDDRRAGRLHAEARIDLRGAAIDALSAAVAGTTIRAGGEIPFDGRPASVSFAGSADDAAWWLEAVPDRWRPSGRIVFEGRAHGPLSDLAADGEASSPDVRLPFWNAGPIEGDFHVAGRKLRFGARVPSLDGTVGGSLALSSPMTLDLTARAGGVDLRRLGEIAAGLGAPRATLTGSATLAGRVTGVVDSDRPIEVEAMVESLAGEVDGRPLRLAGPARIVASASRLAIDGLRLQVGRSTVGASGGLPAGADGRRLHVEADGDLADWWPAASGGVGAAFDVTGSLTDPHLDGEARLASGTFRFGGDRPVPPVTGIGARVRVANDTVELLEASGSWSGATMTAAGRAPMSFLTRSRDAARRGPDLPAASGRLRASLTGLTPSALEPWLGRDAVSQIAGRAEAQLDLEASAPAIDALRGTLVVTQSETTVPGATLQQPKPARLTIDNGRVAIADASWIAAGRTVTLSGGADLRGERPRVDVRLNGDVDLAVTRALVPFALSGTAAVDARATGEVGRLTFSGGASLTDVAVGIPRPRVAISGVTGRLTLQDARLIVSAQGNVNGGTVVVSGALPLQRPARGATPLPDPLRVRGSGFLLEWPEGLRATIDGDVAYRLDDRGGILAGQILADPAPYRRTALPSFSGSATTKAAGSPATTSFFDATRLDLSIATRSPGLIANSYARVEAEATLHVTGTVGQPTVAGSLDVREGGEVYLRGNVFRIERGTLALNREPGRPTSVNLLARTRRSGYDIRLQMTGALDDLQTLLTSDPPLAQPDLMALITTGSTSNSMSPGAQSGTSQDALVAAISSDILGLAGKTVGLDSVRVGQLELDLMGDDVDPQTRLTIGKSIGSWLDLLLSQNLRESGLTWAVTVHPAGRVQVRFVSRDSESNSVQVAHEIVFGRRSTAAAAARMPPAPVTPSRLVAAVTVEGGGLPDGEVLAGTKMRPGRRFDFFEWQNDRERIERLFRDRGYLQAQVSATREPAGGAAAVALRYQVRLGPATRLQISGFSFADAVVEGMKTAWSESVDDQFLQEDLVERARGALIDAGHLRPEVHVTITNAAAPPEKTADVRITPGPHVSRRHVVFEGRRALGERELRNELAATGAAEKGWRDPPAIVSAIEALYRRRGFLDAKAAASPVVIDGSVARLPITIREGPRHVVSVVQVRGSGPIAPTAILGWLRWRAGDPFNPADVADAVKRVEAGCAAEGYRLAEAGVATAIDPATAHVAVTVDVTPGVRSVVGDVQVIGRGETRETIVRRAIDMPIGSPASAAAADRAQRRLYETEAFRSVDVRLEPIGPSAGKDARATAGKDARATAEQPTAPEQPTRVVATLEEAPLYRLRYGVQLTDDLTTATQISDLRLGVSAELRRRNLFGTGLSAAVGGRYEPGNYSARAALNVPTSVFWPALSTLYVKQSLSTAEGEAGPVETVESSLTYQERWRLGQRSELSYGYTFAREELRNPGSVGLPAVEPSVSHRANLFAALAWDQRDSAFNATRGWFHSSSLEYGAPAIASDFSYLRYLFQQTYYRKAGPIVLAAAARTGVLVGVTGDDAETYNVRFRTGGDRTVRGYPLDSLTAPGESGAMVGGRGLLILNGEVRVPVWRWLKAAGFLDAGNAFDTPGHIALHALKVGTGFGIRLDTPYALFRLDLGFPVPQSGPLVRRWYFSIGQAF